MSQEPLRLAVAGAAGRMGRAVLRTALEIEEIDLVGATVRPAHAWVGTDLGEVLGLGHRINVTVSDNASAACTTAQALVDFTTPAASLAHLELAAQERLVHVIGTTGFAAEDLGKFRSAAERAVIIRAGNMSLGINLLAGLVRQAAAALGDSWDAEIVEMHHNRKIDAPSGTALMLGEAVAAGHGTTLDDHARRGRDGAIGPRRRGEIGFAALRGGDVVGEHEVVFAGPGERVVLRHIATDRNIYAQGAVRAALWGCGRPPGEYTMADVLGPDEQKAG